MKYILLFLFSLTTFHAHSFIKKSLDSYKDLHIDYTNNFILENKSDLLRVLKSNRTTLKEPELIGFDVVWSKDKNFVSELLANKYSIKFQEITKNTKYQISEVMLVNNQGSLISASSKTTDHYQGDEEKFIKSNETREVHSTLPKWDESTRVVSFFISNPIYESGELLGMLIIGVDVSSEYLRKSDLRKLNFMRKITKPIKD
jgi:hypothetical protein